MAMPLQWAAKPQRAQSVRPTSRAMPAAEETPEARWKLAQWALKVELVAKQRKARSLVPKLEGLALLRMACSSAPGMSEWRSLTASGD